MGESILLVVYGLAFLLLFTALGSGPVALLARDLRDAWSIAPVAGFALAAALLTTSAAILAMEIAAWLVLAPAAIASLTIAVLTVRLGLRPSWRALTLAAVVIAALALGLAPGLVRGTLGPVSLAIYDAWGYIATDLWLESNSLRDEPPADAARYDLSLDYGHGATSSDQRIGVSAVNAAAATLFGAEPDETHLAFLASLFALLPAVVWFLARGLGASPIGAAVAAAAALSPAVYTLVADSALANLAGLVLVLPALYVLFRALLDGGRIVVLAGLFAAALAAVYPEFLPPFVAVGAAAATVALWRNRRSLQRVALRAGAIVAVAFVAAPIAAVRAAAYLTDIESASLDGLPPRFLTLENGPAWMFGVLHLYELPRFALLSDPKRAFAVYAPVGFAVLVVLALRRRPVERVVFLAVPGVVALALGMTAYERYQSGHCEYCLWKSLTFMLPFLAVAIGLGFDEAVRRNGSPASPYRAVALLPIVLAMLAIFARADLAILRGLEHTPAAVPSQLRDFVAEALSAAPGNASILLEAPDASVSPKWTVPEAYYFVRRIGDPQLSFLPTSDAGAYLGTGVLTDADRFYELDYSHVVSVFPGLRTNRTRLASEGVYALDRRAPIDVVLARTGWALDPREGERAIPWISQAFELWVSAPRPGPVAVELQFDAGSAVPLEASREGGLLPIARSADGRRQCISVPMSQRRARLTVTPQFTAAVPIPGRPTEEYPVPPPAKVLGLRAVEGREGRCVFAGATALPTVALAGWYAPELVVDTTVQWMRSTTGVVRIGERGNARSAVRLEFDATSLAFARRLRVSLGTRTLTEAIVPGRWGFRHFSIAVPAGRGIVELRFDAKPGPAPASIVNPVDRRSLSIAVRGLRVIPLQTP